MQTFEEAYEELRAVWKDFVNEVVKIVFTVEWLALFGIVLALSIMFEAFKLFG